MKSKCGCTQGRKPSTQATSGFGPSRREHAPRVRRAPLPSSGYDAVSRSGMPSHAHDGAREPRRDASVNASRLQSSLRDPRTGLPRGLKRAAEEQSGIAMDDVRVRYNSTLPGSVRAKAATKGARIDVGPGEDGHVGHELWHVVQQKLRRVSADGSRDGHAVNRSEALESEADEFADERAMPSRSAAEPGMLRSVAAPALAPMQLQDSDDESSISDDSEDERAKKKQKKPKKPAQSKLKRKASKQSFSSSSDSDESSSSSGSEDESSSSSGSEDETSSSSGSEDESSSSGSEAPQKKLKGGTKASPKAVKVKAKKEPVKRKAPVKKKAVAKDSDDEGSGTDVAEADWEKGVLDFHGVKQQGKVSVAKGKHYAGPRPMKGKRADQVSRHVANLTLNRSTKAMKDKGSKQKPVEVQMSSVGGRVLINANNRESTEAIASGVGTGSLYDYVMGDEAQKPALDQDTMRPMRYRSKLQKTKAKTRPWQQSTAVGEDATDIGKANKIMESIQEPGIGIFDPDDEEDVKKKVAEWKAGKGPKSYVVLHGKENLKGEHAERVQSAFRDKWLKEFEDPALSTPPTGPKTTCLGCASYHGANYPHILPTPDLSGAYFSSGSPATSKMEIEKAKETIKDKPATGSIGQEGYIRNSDYPDSDSDDEGKPSYPRAMSFTLPQGGKNPEKWTWKTTPTDTLTVSAKEKRYQVENRRRKAAKEKALPKPVNPSTPKAPPKAKKKKADTTAKNTTGGKNPKKKVKTITKS